MTKVNMSILAKVFYGPNYLASDRHRFNLITKLGESGNDFWSVYFELNRNNIIGVDWSVDSREKEIGWIDQQDYSPYVLYNYYMQPILRGEYGVYTVVGDY